MSDNKSMIMPLKVKVLRSRKSQRVLCLECGKEFADLLLSLLIMPVGTILKLLRDGGLAKSDDNGLFNLYESMKQLEESAFAVDRKSLIDPVICSGYSNDLLRLKIAKTETCFNPQCKNETHSKGQVCDDCEAVNWNCCPSLHQPDWYDASYMEQCLAHFKNQTYGSGPVHICPSCKRSVSHYAVVLRRKGVHSSSEQKTTSSVDGATRARGRGFVEKNITFMIKEDLSIIKSSALSALALLQSMKSDLSDLDMKDVGVGKKEGLLLVRAAMVSKRPLTDVFEPFFG